MGEMDLSPTAQQWMLVVLVWVGFGTLAGLLARAVLPGRRPEGAAGTVALGIIGSAAGLFAISLAANTPAEGGGFNPINPLGLLSATGATAIMLVLYRLASSFVAARLEPADEAGEEEYEEADEEVRGRAA